MTTPRPVHKTNIQITGDAIAVTGESMSDTGDGVTFEIDDGDKDIWDPSAQVKVYDGGSLVSSGYEEQYILGRIKFDSAPAGAVTVDVSYFPKFPVSEASSFDLTISKNLQNTPALPNEGERRSKAKTDFTASMDQYELGANTIDTAGTEDTYADLFAGRLLVAEFELETSASPVPTIRALGYFSEQDFGSDANDISDVSVSFEASQQNKNGNNLAFPRLYRFKG